MTAAGSTRTTARDLPADGHPAGQGAADAQHSRGAGTFPHRASGSVCLYQT